MPKSSSSIKNSKILQKSAINRKSSTNKTKPSRSTSCSLTKIHTKILKIWNKLQGIIIFSVVLCIVRHEVVQRRKEQEEVKWQHKQATLSEHEVAEIEFNRGQVNFNLSDVTTTDPPSIQVKLTDKELFENEVKKILSDITLPSEPLDGPWSCPFNHPNQNKIFKPKKESERYLQVRKDKFLMSASPFGPNNQIRGFRDNIILAYYLDRTVVLPDFCKHPTDPSYVSDSSSNVESFPFTKNIQHANEKFDIYALSKFINVITMAELADRNLCVKKPLDIAYHARTPGKDTAGSQFWSQLKAYEKMYGFEITKNLTNEEYLKPENLKLNAKFEFIPSMSKDTVKSGHNKIRMIHATLNCL